ncbi:hypothetical protein OHA18_29075 [Kribbella sp. NBC_00709]|uniref:hypothetical protein n=1 Tax=Kribbella sp. NBC_00709 TaxID=2975972 RepID=UPI002E2876DB|nr:hypothetical protein [Kribbella sp. NBC_00709]
MAWSDNSSLWSFIGLVVLGVAVWFAAGRLRGGHSVGPSANGGRQRSWAPAVAAIVLALVAPVVLWAAAGLMTTLSYSDPSFDAWGLVLQVLPAALVSAAAVRCARTGLREVHGQTPGRVLALSAIVLAYLVAGLMLATALVACAAMMNAGG